jgi:hypothetical protein
MKVQQVVFVVLVYHQEPYLVVLVQLLSYDQMTLVLVGVVLLH